MPWGRHVYHVYTLRSEDRDGCKQHCWRKRIQTAIHYPVPVHLQPAYSDLGYSDGSVSAIGESGAAGSVTSSVSRTSPAGSPRSCGRCEKSGCESGTNGRGALKPYRTFWLNIFG